MNCVATSPETDGACFRVLVVDEQEVVLWGMRAALGAQPWVSRCIPAATREQALERAGRYDPHVALVDLLVGDVPGALLARELRARCPALRVVLTSRGRRISERAARRAGASGYVSKREPLREVLAVAHAVALGSTHFAGYPSASRLVLTERETRILERIADGATNREIAVDLGVSSETVKQQASGLYRKLAARNRAQAVVRATELGLASSALRSYETA
jgi:two-component system response regulator DesR